MGIARKARIFWPLLGMLLLADCATKELAETYLDPSVPKPVVGEFFRLTLAYNPGAAMNLSLGRFSRVGFSLAAIAVSIVLWRWYRRPDTARPGLVAALALVTGGALGNLFDRLRSPRGVVDFIDLGLGSARFWTFNIADIGVSLGAILLAWYVSRPQAAPTATQT